MTCFSDLIGVEFAYGGRGPELYDCWGLVRECHRRFHDVELPDYPSDVLPAANALLMEREANRLWQPVEQTPGAVLLLRWRGLGAHVGFQHTSTRFLHATEEVGVQEARIPSFQRMIIGAYRYVGV